jgi:hypothetical protein
MARHSDRNFYLKFPSSCYVRETEKAKCYLLDGQHLWIPKSQIVHEDEDESGRETSMTLPEWLVIEKGLEIYADPQWIDAGEPD